METPHKRKRKYLPVKAAHCVYVITCGATGEQYVGSAAFFNQRISRHRCELRKGTHWNPRMQAAWAAHGERCFTFALLAHEPDKATAMAHEQRLLDALRPAFNVHREATSPLGTRHSAETRAKMSAAHLRYWGKETAATTAHKAALKARPRKADGTYGNF